MGGGASREPGQKTRQRPSSLSSRVQRVIASKFGVADSDDSDDDKEERRKVREQKRATVQQKSVRPPRSVFWHALYAWFLALEWGYTSCCVCLSLYVCYLPPRC